LLDEPDLLNLWTCRFAEVRLSNTVEVAEGKTMTKILSKTAVLAKWLTAPVALLVAMPALAGACCVVGALCCGLPCCD
jgi:hypothetical protein